jgi:hypothetical protein
MFKKKPSINVNKKDCCEDDVVSDGVINDLSFDSVTNVITASTTLGASYSADLTALSGVDGVATGVVYDSSTGLLTISRSNGLPDISTPITSVTSTVANTLFVMENGDDATAVRERFDLPFATVSAAQQAAQSGDTVEVYAGVYNEPDPISASNVLAKDGVNYYFHPNTFLTYSSTVGGNSPFWDQGVPVVCKIWGHANIRVNNGISPEFQLWLTHPDSDLQLECNSLSIRRRIRCTNGTRLHIHCHEEIRCTFVQVLSIRLAPDTDMDFRLTATDFYATREDAGGNTAWSAIGLRDFGEGANIYMKFNRIHVGNSFSSTGYYYFQNIKCPIYFHYNTMVYTSDASWDQNQKHLFVSVLDNAEWNSSMHISHIGQWARWATRPTGLGTSRGHLKIHGKHETTTNPLSFLRSQTQGLPLDTHLTIELDIEVDNQFQGGNKANGDYIRLNDGQQNLKITGQIKHTCDEVDSNIIHVFRQDFNAAWQLVTFKELTIETQSTFLVDSVSGAQADIPCMGVFANVGLDPVKHAAVIEPITVSPSVKA